jgi:hypothetical protein
VPILTENIKIRASQRLTDNDDGGGFMTATEIVDGNINNLFNDISRLDRTYGRVSLRKFFLHVDTEDTEMYSGSHLIISELAQDPNIKVALFSTENDADTRVDARNRLESYVTLGPRFQGWLWGDQPAGSRALLIFQPVGTEPPEVGAVLCLFNNKGTATEFSQYVRVTGSSVETRSFNATSGTSSTSFTRQVVTVEIGDPLEATFTGAEITNNDSTPTSVYTTIVSNAAKYYGVMIPTAEIGANDVTVMVDSIYTQLVPTSQAETPLLGLTPGLVGPIKASGAAQTLTFPSATWTTLNLGQAFVAGTLVLAVGGNAYTDAGNGVLMLGSNQAGTVDYHLGQIVFTTGVTGEVSAAFDPGAAMSLTPSTLMVPVFAASRGYNYVAMLWPPPAPGTVMVDYLAEGQWYRLRDDGAGYLQPDIENTGTGRIDYALGQVSVTCAALPDVDSPILVRWGNPVEIIKMQGAVTIEVDPVHHTLTGTPVDPGSLTITWPVGISTTATATDNGAGVITGDATGWINYGTGELEFTPTLLPVADSDYTVNHDKYAAQTHSASGASFTLPGAPLKPGSVAIDVPLTISGWTHTYHLRDQGNGTLTAPGFSATLKQARASLNDSYQSVSSSGTSSTVAGSMYDGGSEDDSSFLVNDEEETVTLIAEGISATVDYVTGAVVMNVSTATAKKNTIKTMAEATGSSGTVIDITGRLF